ncbi:tRNA (guanosine(46)-N7)-methyltransferase TrmB [Thermodesulfobacterium hydrogeniphilum]|uniref:tRNA (guanosine(46)-N7)-methyltransferase TrmB n=1 Tax=Thermodesulfobacterium hydrogeniphilum TaxID=161156 RepID=UPI000A04DD94|nr:tRNA (guanosine(46)-N7)-methyltransferase TrmB [Thermodesulfobacterium hydrogeniphilum]
MRDFFKTVLKENELGIKPDWDKIFGRKGPLYLEIGIGNGEFIVWLAQNKPEANFIGVEVSREYFRKAVNRAINAKLANLRLICIEGAKALSKLFDSETLAGLYLNFPDPWAKKSQKERRLVNPAFIWLLGDRLVLEGFFIMVTDYEPYAKEVLEHFLKCPVFEPLWDTPLKMNLTEYYHTKYARKWLSMGLSLFYIGFKKVKRVELPEWISKFYPLIKLKKEEPLPLNILKLGKSVTLKEFLKFFSKDVIWKKGEELIKILDIYFKEDGILLDTLVVEGLLKQRFFISINPYDKDGVIISIHDSDHPDPTDGVHKALVLITLKIQEKFPQAKLIQSNCKIKAFREIKKEKGLE